MHALITESGVLSSCETLATNSCRTLSNRRNSVVSCKTNTAPRGRLRQTGRVNRQTLGVWPVPADLSLTRLRPFESLADNVLKTSFANDLPEFSTNRAGGLELQQLSRPVIDKKDTLFRINAITPSTMAPRIVRSCWRSSCSCEYWSANRSLI